MKGDSREQEVTKPLVQRYGCFFLSYSSFLYQESSAVFIHRRLCLLGSLDL